MIVILHWKTDKECSLEKRLIPNMNYTVKYPMQNANNSLGREARYIIHTYNLTLMIGIKIVI